MKASLVVLTIIITALFQDALLALGGPENVLVVQNANSAISHRVADYYMSRRNIPSNNLVTINVPDANSNEIITPADYKSKIEQPIKDFLAANGLTNQIQFIVMTKGIPHMIGPEPTAGTYPYDKCMDNVLATIDLINPFEIGLYDNATPQNYYGTLTANRYWRAAEPFTHAKYGGYLVTRLDGYTEADAKALVDRALATQSVPYRILLDVDPGFGIGDPSVQPKPLLTPDGTQVSPDFDINYPDYNADMMRAAQILSLRPQVSVTLESTNTFAASINPLMGYVSWGSNDHHYSAATYNSLTFTPGSIIETAVSTSGRAFRPVTNGQSMIADLIAQGAAGAKGYVNEPYLFSMASPTVLFDLYTSGRNLAESYYAASRFVGWKDCVVGDPLCCLSGEVKATVSDAKALPDGYLVSLTNKIVSAGTDSFSDRFYIQDFDRSSGIQVYLGRKFPGIVEGSTVSVRGVLATQGGERVITNASVTGAIQINPTPPAPSAAKTTALVVLKKLQ